MIHEIPKFRKIHTQEKENKVTRFIFMFSIMNRCYGINVSKKRQTRFESIDHERFV
jgi:hypothetical protein